MDDNTTGRKTRSGKPYLIKKAPPDALVYRIGFVIGAKKLKHHSLIARVKEPSEGRKGEGR